MKLIKQLLCKHVDLKFVDNLYGEEIIASNYKRSIWKCNSCDKIVYKVDLYLPGKVSDGYHTFDELYEHRIELFLALCRMADLAWVYGAKVNKDGKKLERPWRAKLHKDGTMYPGYFIAGIGQRRGQQITYHIPIKYWEDCTCFKTLNRAPVFDGHTSNDVLKRLNTL